MPDEARRTRRWARAPAPLPTLRHCFVARMCGATSGTATHRLAAWRLMRTASLRPSASRRLQALHPDDRAVARRSRSGACRNHAKIRQRIIVLRETAPFCGAVFYLQGICPSKIDEVELMVDLKTAKALGLSIARRSRRCVRMEALAAVHEFPHGALHAMMQCMIARIGIRTTMCEGPRDPTTRPSQPQGNRTWPNGSVLSRVARPASARWKAIASRYIPATCSPAPSRAARN